MTKTQTTQLSKCIKKGTMTVKQFDKVFGTNIANTTNRFERLSAQVEANDTVMLGNGLRLKSVNNFDHFEVQTNKKEIKSYYKNKAANARARAQLVK